MEHNKVVSELFSQCSMKPNAGRGNDSDDEGNDEDEATNQIQAPKKKKHTARMKPWLGNKQPELNTTQYNIDNLFERSVYQANAGSPQLIREDAD
jgi:hypothetical protein